MGTTQLSDAFRMLATAVLFLLFFETTKHTPAIARINPFAEDPYDAVGSFAIQFALFIALLSLIRAFRARTSGPDRDLERLIARGDLLCVSAVLLTLLADCTALARHTAMWRDSAASRELLVLTGGLWLWCFAVLSLWHRTVMRLQLWPSVTRRGALWATLAAFVAVLAIYPERLRQTLPGELLTVVIGMLLLFGPLLVIARLIPMNATEADGDTMDEVFWLCRTAKSGLLSLLGLRRSDRGSTPASQRTTHSRPPWLLRHRWTCTVIIGIATGALFAEQELTGNQTPVRLEQLLLVGSVFVGLESTAVLLGAALLNRPLRLLRTPSSGGNDAASHTI